MPVLWSLCLVIHRGEYSLRAADIESGLSGTSQNQSGILVRHQDKKGTVKEGTREREARFLNQGTEVQALLPVRILGLLVLRPPRAAKGLTLRELSGTQTLKGFFLLSGK